MKLTASEPGVVVSASAHTALLVAALVGFWSPRTLDEQPEAVPVEMITEAELRQITRGERDAKKVEPPAPPAPRIAAAPEKKPDPPAPKEEAAVTPPPRPEPPKPEPPKPDPPKPAEAKPEPPPRPLEPAPTPPTRSAAPPEPKKVEPPKDAEIIKPAPAKPEPKKPDPKPVEKPKAVAKPAPKPPGDDEEVEKPKPAKPPQRPAEKPARNPDAIAKLLEQPAAKPAPAAPAAPTGFDPSKILGVVRQRQPAGGADKPAPAPTPGAQARLGAPTATAAKLTPSDREALTQLVSEHFRRCWNLPPGASPAYKPVLSFSVSEAGVAGAPIVTNRRSEPTFQAVADSAVRAVQRCAQLSIPARFKPSYADWARMTITFNPEDAL